MRKPTVVTVIVVLVLLMNPRSESNAQTNVNVGIKAGLGIASCSGLDDLFEPAEWGGYTPSVDKGSRLGVVVGGFLELRLVENVFIQPEFLYVQGGCKRDIGIDFYEAMGAIEVFVEGSVESSEDLNYLEIPILLKYVVSGGSGSGPYFLAGPSIGIKLSAEMAYGFAATVSVYEDGVLTDSEYISDSGSEDLDDYLKGTNFSMIFGAGYIQELAQGALFVEARFSLGLTDIFEDTYDIETWPNVYVYLEDAKTRLLSITVGYAFL
ncbi:MAG: PorT family protein [bacterium]|nr:MAG: PorT family protein [bacterium]